MSGFDRNASDTGATRQRRLPNVAAMSTVTFTAALAFVLAGLLLPAAHALHEPGVDPDTHPGDDFFRYANGAWLKAASIPEGQPRWGARQEIAAATQQQIGRLLDDADQAPPGSDARKLADFRTAYLDERTIEARGLARLKPLLQSIDRLRDKAGLTRWLGRELRADVDPINAGLYDSSHVLGLSLQSGIHGERVYVAYLVQGGLGLPQREAYLGNDAASQALRSRHQAAIAHTLNALGVASEQAARRAAAVMALETALARSHASREVSANERNADTLWSRRDFAREAPGMDWTVFFAAAGLARQQNFVPWQPGAVKGVAALVASQPLQAWQDYLRVRSVARFADVLPRALSVEALPADERARRALAATHAALGDLVGRLYVERHFPPEQKARVQRIAADVIAAFTRRVEAAPWLSAGARTMALAKLERLYFGVGYPDRWPDDAALVVDPADAVGNLQRIAQRDRARALARLGQPVDRSAWFIAPQAPGAVLTFNENSYSFAAALLQVPKFDAAADDAANYGAIGAIVGHDVSHFVDTLGAEYEADGRLRRWWTADDLARYHAVTEPLVRQFSAYRPVPGSPDVAVDGKLGLVENLADLGGLAAAFDAHRRALGARAQDAPTVRQQDRRFFIGFARAWRIKVRDETMKAQAASDHSPEHTRIWTVRNLDAWYDAFDVRPGHRLYLEPGSRVKVW